MITYNPYQNKNDSNFDHIKAVLSNMSAYKGMTLYSVEERELIACAFKNQLKELRMALKDIQIIESKPKYDSKKDLMDRYKVGLVRELIAKGERQV